MSDRIIIDADCHVIEPFELWQTHIDPAFADRAPRLVPRRTDERLADRLARLGARALWPLPPEARFAGRPVMRDLNEAELLDQVGRAMARMHELARLGDPQTYIDRMAREAVTASVLLPTHALCLVSMADVEPDLMWAVIDAYNRWLRDFCAAAPGRLVGVGLLCPHRPETLPDQVRMFTEWGFRGAVMRPNPFGGRLIGDPIYDPLWRALTAVDLPLVIHDGIHGWSPNAGADRFESSFARHACSHPMEAMMAYLSLFEGGVFERHSALKVAFLESGAGWVPYWMWRLDADFGQWGSTSAGRRSPSRCFREQCMVAMEPDEPSPARLIEAIGPDSVIFGSDFPHLDHAGDAAGAMLELASVIGDAALDGVLNRNPVRLFGLSGRLDQMQQVNG